MLTVKRRVTMDIDFEFRCDDIEKLHGENWGSAVAESINEFSSELQEFIIKHPLIIACKSQISERSSDDPADL